MQMTYQQHKANFAFSYYYYFAPSVGQLLHDGWRPV